MFEFFDNLISDISQFFISNGISFETIILILFAFGSFVFSLFKLRGSRLEKDYKKAIKNLSANNFYLKLRGKYYDLNECTFIKKESISPEEFKINKG